ncbi:DUF3035 domain-containing protein [Sphingomonas koreensis]|nr:DUF3035 domain-containing protein [Sphingomonas koreensis]TPG39579.1 DUF3035 domain-containing protein [Sphingomonas koreensis]
MRKMVPIALGLGLAIALAGCAGRRSLNTGPDEFEVAREAPLVIPPDFSLTPPQPGAARPQDVDPGTQALAAMFGGPAARSASENAALTAAGNDQAEPGIRSEAGDPDTTVVDKGSVTRDIEAAPAGDGQEASTATP